MWGKSLKKETNLISNFKLQHSIKQNSTYGCNSIKADCSFLDCLPFFFFFWVFVEGSLCGTWVLASLKLTLVWMSSALSLLHHVYANVNIVWSACLWNLIAACKLEQNKNFKATLFYEVAPCLQQKFPVPSLQIHSLCSEKKHHHPISTSIWRRWLSQWYHYMGKKKTLKFEVNFFFFLVYPPPGLLVNSPYLIHV